MAETTRAFDIIGSIALISDNARNPEELAEKILKTHKKIKTIGIRAGQAKGKYRIRPIKILKGTKTTITTHKENDCSFKIDLSKAFYTPRLQTERLRILKQTMPAEKVLDMFAGIGPYSIQLAKHKNCKVTSIEWNPNACKLMKENAKLNKVKIRIICEDARTALKEIKTRYDRIIMNAPRQNNNNTLRLAKKNLKDTGIIHYYTTSENKDKLILKDLKIINEKRTITYSPGKYQLCLDLKLFKYE